MLAKSNMGLRNTKETIRKKNQNAYYNRKRKGENTWKDALRFHSSSNTKAPNLKDKNWPKLY
jgi:hypothetical protein